MGQQQSCLAIAPTCTRTDPIPPTDCALREERYVAIRDEMGHMLARVGWEPGMFDATGVLAVQRGANQLAE